MRQQAPQRPVAHPGNGGKDRTGDPRIGYEDAIERRESPDPLTTRVKDHPARPPVINGFTRASLSDTGRLTKIGST